MCIISSLINVVTRLVDPPRYDQWSDRNATRGLTAMRPEVWPRCDQRSDHDATRGLIAMRPVVWPWCDQWSHCNTITEICSLCSAARPWIALQRLVHFKQAITHSNWIRIEEDIVKTSVLCSALRPMASVQRYIHYAPRSDHGSDCGDCSVSNKLLYIQIGS